MDLRGLWQATEGYGGYDAATAAKKWSAIASAQGLDLKRYTSGACGQTGALALHSTERKRRVHQRCGGGCCAGPHQCPFQLAAP